MPLLKIDFLSTFFLCLVVPFFLLVSVGGSDGIDQWQETDHGGDVQTMQFGDDMPNDGGGGDGSDLFSRWLMNAPTDAPHYRPVEVDRRCLTAMKSSEVYIVRCAPFVVSLSLCVC